jgi:heptosyltransferase III
VKSTRYSSPTGIHGLRRRVVRRLINRLLGQPAAPSAEPLPTKDINRILICRTSHSLGNTILLTPLLQEIEALYPGAEVDIVTQSGAAGDICGQYFSVRHIHVLPSRFPEHPLETIRVLRHLRNTHYDLVIDPDKQSKTGRLLLTVARATYKLGFVNEEKGGGVTHGVPIPDDIRRIGQLPVYLLRTAIGGNGKDLGGYPPPDLRLTGIERQHGREVLARLASKSGALASKKGAIGIFANATGGKRRDLAWWQRLLKVLEARYPDYDFIELIPMYGSSLLDSRYPAYYSSEIRKLASVISALSLYVSIDCGIMHLACASDVPTMGIFTGTDASEWGPYGPGRHVIEAVDRSPEEVAEEIIALGFRQR